jgi:hypothetical protein
LISALLNFFGGHLSDDDLTLLVMGGGPHRKQAQAERHLAECHRCVARYSHFENAFSQVADRCAHYAVVDMQQEREQRARLAAKLDQLAPGRPDIEAIRPQQNKNVTRWELSPMDPLLATGFVLAVASVTCVFMWLQHPKPSMTSNQLLVRAERWDNDGTRKAETGVIRQTVSITTSNQTLKRTIYRDARGERRAKQRPVILAEDQLRQRLAMVNVNWDAPLSAASYQDWHDQQRVREDQIQRAGNLLVLTTSTPNGMVASQSLAVRDTDFHPVRRTVFFRDRETVEVAELDYAVLPWTSVDGSLFLPEKNVISLEPTRQEATLVQLRPPVPAEGQLDEAELSARLTLNRLHADAGEQIEIVRRGDRVEVLGITDSEEQKRELEKQLRILPYVGTSISSIEEMKKSTSQPGETSGPKVVEIQTQTTPLETYYLSHGRSIAPLGELSEQLVNCAFVVSLESKSIIDLQERFGKRDGPSLIASATLADLLFTHKYRLLSSLQTEEELLSGVHIPDGVAEPVLPSGEAELPLSALAEQNLALAKELVLGSGSNGRPADVTVGELHGVIRSLYRRAHQTQVVPQSSTNVGQGK